MYGWDFVTNGTYILCWQRKTDGPLKAPFFGGGTQQILTSWFMLFVSSKSFVFDHLEAGGTNGLVA